MHIKNRSQSNLYSNPILKIIRNVDVCVCVCVCVCQSKTVSVVPKLFLRHKTEFGNLLDTRSHSKFT